MVDGVRIEAEQFAGQARQQFQGFIQPARQRGGAGSIVQNGSKLHLSEQRAANDR